MTSPLPRFEAVSRRQFLARSAAVGAAALVGAGCGNDDKARLGSETIPTTATSPAATSTVAPTSTAVPATDAATTTTSPPTTQPAATGDAFPGGAQLEVAFTFSGQGRNPYVAVWIETPAGDMVQTVSLWLQIQRSQYLEHLKRWYNAEATLLDAGGTNNLDAIAGASRPAGDYQVVWDGSDTDGNPVAQGDYVLCIEGAHEHGAYEFTSGPITIGTKSFETTLADNGDLSAVKVKFVV